MRALRSAVWLLSLLFGLAAGCGSSLQPAGAGGARGTGGSSAGGSPGPGGGDGGAHGGADGGADAGALVAVCRSLAQAYAAAMPAAARCSVGTDSCTTLVPESLAGNGCVTNCQVYVRDATTLNAIMQSLEQAGCDKLPVCVAPILCATPAAGLCMPTDGGDARCQNLYDVL